MNDLEQRLADELGAVATELRTPHLAVPGLVAAGRRERVRRRSAVAGLVAATVAVVFAAGLAVTLPGGEERGVEPGTGPDAAYDLARPLTLPWWGPDDGLLRVEGAEIPVAATRIVKARRQTLVEQGTGSAARWWRVDGASLSRLSRNPLVGAPVAGPDDSLAWVSDQGADGYVVTLQTEGSGSSLVLSDWVGEPPQLLGVLNGARVVLVDGVGDARVWDLDTGGSVPLEGLPDDARPGYPAPWSRGLAVRDGARILLGEVDRRGRFEHIGQVPAVGEGVWSNDGSTLAAVGPEGIRLATGSTVRTIPLDQSDLRVVGWENTREVVVAQYLEADGAVTGVWRCGVGVGKCAEVTDAPNGRVLLPGL